MKLNRSLAISNKIHECTTGNIIGLMEKHFPNELFNRKSLDTKKQSRSRVFTLKNTLLTMTLSATQKDKSLKNSVILSYIIHQNHKKQLQMKLEQGMQKQKEMDQKAEKKAGRPSKYNVHLPKYLEKDISLNTAAYSKARGRVPVELTQELFDASRIQQAKNSYTHWHGYRVFSGDGTYVQMQDTESIRKEYEVKHKGVASDGYPQGLLEVIIERGTGQLFSFKLANRHVSELALFYDMIDDLPQKSLLLLDDLYNCFEIISKCNRKGIELVMPAKRERNYELVEVLGKGDEIIRIKTPKNRSKWLEKNEKAGSFLLRRIQCKSPDGKDYVLNSTILDKEITREDIHLIYLTRWDVEIGIREIKTIMDINILRSKTPEMALKELTVSLATYNLIRKIIYASIKDLSFSPEEDFIFKFYSINKDIFIDKKGRVYSRWSTGRRGTNETNSRSDVTKERA